jgi:hypothetical protein
VEPSEAVPIGENAASAMAQAGPDVIYCSGCGPTLADRRFASTGRLDGDSQIDGLRDPVEQDYPTDEEAPQVHPAPQPVRLPANVERFAAGDAGVPPPPVRSTMARPTIPTRTDSGIVLASTAGAP